MVHRDLTEERWNSGTHLVAALLSVGGASWMLSIVSSPSPSAAALACVIYAVVLALMFLMSTLSHWFRDDQRMSKYRSLDQGFILILIVATYTPFSLHFWDSTFANSLLALMWLIAITGFVGKVIFARRVQQVSVLGYVLLGWMPVVGLPFHETWPVTCMLWILAGGVVYSVGTLFLINDRKYHWCHPVWHLLVMVAAAIHFYAVARFVALASIN